MTRRITDDHISKELVEQMNPNCINYQMIMQELGNRYTERDEDEKRGVHSWLNLCRGCSYCGDMFPVKSDWQITYIDDWICSRKWVAVCPVCGAGFGLRKRQRKGERAEELTLSNTFDSISELEGVEYFRK